MPSHCKVFVTTVQPTSAGFTRSPAISRTKKQRAQGEVNELVCLTELFRLYFTRVQCQPLSSPCGPLLEWALAVRSEDPA